MLYSWCCFCFDLCFFLQGFQLCQPVFFRKGWIVERLSNSVNIDMILKFIPNKLWNFECFDIALLNSLFARYTYMFRLERSFKLCSLNCVVKDQSKIQHKHKAPIVIIQHCLCLYLRSVSVVEIIHRRQPQYGYPASVSYSRLVAAGLRVWITWKENTKGNKHDKECVTMVD